MKRLAIVLAVCLFFGAMMPSAALACETGKVTFGGWQHRLIGPEYVSSSTWSYSGNAISTSRWSYAAKGSIQMQRDTDTDLRIHADVVTLAVRHSDHMAWIGGVVLTSNDPEWDVGDTFIVQCQDNGEGVNAVNDRTSELFAADPWDVEFMAPLYLYGWSGGNVQLHVNK